MLVVAAENGVRGGLSVYHFTCVSKPGSGGPRFPYLQVASNPSSSGFKSIFRWLEVHLQVASSGHTAGHPEGRPGGGTGAGGGRRCTAPRTRGTSAAGPRGRWAPGGRGAPPPAGPSARCGRGPPTAGAGRWRRRPGGGSSETRTPQPG